MATVAKNSRSTTSTLASATAGPFSVGFRLFDDDALLVYVNGVSRADWTLSSTYADGYDDDASITFDAALDIADDLRIEGWLSPARSADYVNGDPGLTTKMNIELARLWSSVIEVKREVSRALRGFDALSPVDGVDLETVAAAETYATAASASASAAAASEAAALAAENSLLEWAGAWQTATAYAPSDIVQESGNSYVCLVAHTSGVFATDLGALKWELFAAKGLSGSGSGDLVAANNLNDVVDPAASLVNLGGQPLNANLTAIAGITVTRGGLITKDGSAIKNLAIGSSGQVLTSDGTDAAWATPSSGMTFLSSVDLASDATADFSLTAGYDAYVFALQNVVHDQTALAYEFWIRTSTDGGSTFDSTATNYVGTAYNVTGTTVTGVNPGTTEIALTGAVGADTGEDGISGTVKVFGPHLAKKTHIHAELTYQSGTGSLVFQITGAYRNSSADVDAIRFLFQAGNLASGTITLWGMKNA